MRGHLKPVILTLLEKENLTGSELIKRIEQKVNWKPSFGSVYPLLDNLVKEGCAVKISDANNKKRKIYVLTKKGQKEAGRKQDEQKELADALLKVHVIMKSLYDMDINMDVEILEEFKKGKIPFSEIHEESMALKAELFRLMKNNGLKKNKNKIQSILNEAINKLKKIKG